MHERNKDIMDNVLYTVNYSINYKTQKGSTHFAIDDSTSQLFHTQRKGMAWNVGNKLHASFRSNYLSPRKPK